MMTETRGVTTSRPDDVWMAAAARDLAQLYAQAEVLGEDDQCRHDAADQHAEIDHPVRVHERQEQRGQVDEVAGLRVHRPATEHAQRRRRDLRVARLLAQAPPALPFRELERAE